MQIRVGIRRDGALVEEEEYALKHSVYDEEQLTALLRDAGFADVRGVDGYAAEGAIGTGDADGVVRIVLAQG
jgi:hypothetical protein